MSIGERPSVRSFPHKRISIGVPQNHRTFHSGVNSSFFVHLFVLFTCHILIACERLRFAHKYSSQAKSRVVGIQVTTRRNHVTFTLQTPISFSLVVICTKCFVYEIEIASIQHEFNTVALISSISDARHQHLYQNE